LEPIKLAIFHFKIMEIMLNLEILKSENFKTLI